MCPTGAVVIKLFLAFQVRKVFLPVPARRRVPQQRRRLSSEVRHLVGLAIHWNLSAHLRRAASPLYPVTIASSVSLAGSTRNRCVKRQTVPMSLHSQDSVLPHWVDSASHRARSQRQQVCSVSRLKRQRRPWKQSRRRHLRSPSRSRRRTAKVQLQVRVRSPVSNLVEQLSLFWLHDCKMDRRGWSMFVIRVKDQSSWTLDFPLWEIIIYVHLHGTGLFCYLPQFSKIEIVNDLFVIWCTANNPASFAFLQSHNI